MPRRGGPIRFGVFELDLAAAELRRNGARVKLQEQPFQVLAALLERPREIVTKQELQERIWKDDTFVDFDRSLATAVNKVRQALGDSATNSRFVETVPRRGYRFIYPLSERQEAVLYAIGAEDPEPITAQRAGLPMDPGGPAQQSVAAAVSSEELVPKRRLRTFQALKDQAPQASTRHLFRSYAPWAAACILALVWALKETTSKDGPVAGFSGPIQFEIRLPEQARFVPAYIGGGVAVSPDGSKLVALGRRRDSSEILFVRELDSAEARPLEGTNNARFPFWSPDGKQLGFAADSELKTVDLERGITRSLAEAPRFRGGAWSDWQGGTILFTPDNTGPLYRIPAQGGDPQPASRLGPGESSHRWPVFFDEGRFLFASPQEGRRRGAIFAADLAEEPSSSHQFVLEADSAAQYTAADQGYLLFLQDQTLLAQPFDARRAATGSGPVPIAQKVETRPYSLLRASFSVSLSGVLAYKRSTGLFGVSELVWFDRQGKRLGALGPPDLYTFVRLSPDEKTAALTIIPEGGHADTWTLDVVRGVLTRRTFHPDHLDRVPIWSPDSQRLLISSTKEDRGTIFVLDAHGSEEPSPFFAVELDRQVSDWPTHWVGPEGPVLFSRRGAEGHDIWEYAPARSPQTRPLIEGTGHQHNARVSPNGNLVAYASDELGDNEIFLQPYSEKGQKIRISTAGGNYPHWRGDGRELFYMSRRADVGWCERRTEPDRQSARETLPNSNALWAFFSGLPVLSDPRRVATSGRYPVGNQPGNRSLELARGPRAVP